MQRNTSLVLSVSHLSASYHQNHVLHDISFDIVQGSCVGIVGPNGAGKSTLLKAVMGIIPKMAGDITFFNTTLAHVRKRVAYVSQKSSVDWDFPATVFDVALMGSYSSLGWFAQPGEKEKNATWDALERVGMVAYAHRPIGLLSGGQQQRVFLARALVQNADLYIMDEPFAGVDMATERVIITLFKQLCDAGKTVMVVHHDLQTLEHYFDTLVVLNKSIRGYGAVKDVMQSGALERAYGRLVHNSLFVKEHDLRL